MTERRDRPEGPRDEASAAPGNGEAVATPPSGSASTTQQVPAQRAGWVQHFPAERPDFEPPPPWARPVPGGSHNGAGPANRAFGVPAASPVQAKEPWFGRYPRRAVLVALAVTIALVAAALGGTAGVLATLQFGPALISTDAPASEDDLGAEGKAFPKPENVATVAQALLPSVVQIKATGGPGSASGSGFVIRKDGYILTNNHVVAPAASGGTIKVSLHGGEEVPGQIVGRSPAYDLAVVRVKDVENLKPVALGDSDRVRVGEPVVALGSPLGLTGTVTTGIVSARNRPVTAGGAESEMSFINALQTDAAVNPGNSGGPLVNLKAEVIGVNSAIATVGDQEPFSGGEQQGSIGLGFSIPMNQARRTADQIIRTGHAVYPVVGAVVDVRHEGPGARLGDIQPDSAAANAGLARGDLVTVINGHKVTGADDLIVQIRSYVPGQRVEMVYERGGKERKAIVTLGKETG
ncbi:trypsin-like peptidase domain-containing protein [Actinopolymorpha sp. B9G3]|uniref:S1C family serine protease n=1 Tax=Actinopolymorpha sp. B9G3 TaxID=3158970 RepID=UPI0032D97DEF